ncbi:MAG: hypothetical protein CME70_15490 [Halobacteriovorax sp.]|nr:hypothetical protein [Halobacteriovorax sp.]|tara:strand:+ start:31054 stop:31401 length:348 start_codon:yes stop_codon:yes gene_type:complete
MDLTKKKGLLAPKDFWTTSETEKKKILNECGGDVVTAALVPNNILGKDVSVACDIHDFMYLKGKTSQDKVVADNTFAKNLKALTDQTQNPILRKLRGLIGRIYYLAASIFGHFYF